MSLRWFSLKSGEIYASLLMYFPDMPILVALYANLEEKLPAPKPINKCFGLSLIFLKVSKKERYLPVYF